jgi:hypothetical protein
MAPEQAWLRGEALEYMQGAFSWRQTRGNAGAETCVVGADRRLHAFSVRDLPKSPAERFKALFAERQRWTREDIEPYLTVRPPCARAARRVR